MKIPRYWVKKNVTQTIDGEPFDLAISGWSDLDLSDAARKALERAEKVFAAIRLGKKKDAYLYSDRPIKEDILSEMKVGTTDILITRTSYGSLVLNCSNLAFIDIDKPEAGFLETLINGFKRIFGVAATEPDENWLAENEAKIAALCAQKQVSIRFYRTFKGLRGLITNRYFEPGSAEIGKIFSELNTDELYVRLCKVQDCFRARLTPKPFRCGLKIPPYAFPFADEAEKNGFAEWEARYTQASEKFATCRFWKSFGDGIPRPEIQKIIDLHDRLTQADSQLNLA